MRDPAGHGPKTLQNPGISQGFVLFILILSKRQMARSWCGGRNGRCLLFF